MRLPFEQYGRIFTPGSPVALRQFLFGRAQELTDIDRCLNRPGLHPIVIGGRGVGKTSLIQSALTGDDSNVIIITCNSSMTFDLFARLVIETIQGKVLPSEISTETQSSVDGKLQPGGLGVAASHAVKDVSKVTGLGSQTINPWVLCQKLQNAGKRILLVIDEYDTVSPDNSVFHRGISETIKTLADFSPRSKYDPRVLVVGVAYSSEALLGKHESIERSAREIYLRPLRQSDVFDFVTEAEDTLQFKFNESVKGKIAYSSMGYPYYFHLVGLECLDVMLEKNKKDRFVTERTYETAMVRAVRKAFRSELGKYKTTVESLSDNEIMLIEELVSLLPEKRVTRSFLQERLNNKGIPRDQFSTTLLALEKDKKIIYLSRNLDDVRFVDPLLAPFLRNLMNIPKSPSRVDANAIKVILDADDS